MPIANAIIERMIELARHITTPIGALVFVTLTSLIAIYFYLSYQQRHFGKYVESIEKAPSDERASIIAKAGDANILSKLGMTTEDLKDKHKFDLLMEELRNQRHRTDTSYGFWKTVALFVFVVLLVVVLRYAPDGEQPPKPPPDQFTISICQTADDPNLEPAFGSSSDDRGMPRNAARTIDAGNILNLSSTREKVKNFWLLTEGATDKQASFTLHVYTNTADKVSIQAFITHLDGSGVLCALRMTGAPTGGIFYYDVPVMQINQALVVSLGMRDDSYTAIADPNKFYLRSKPL